LTLRWFLADVSGRHDLYREGRNMAKIIVGITPIYGHVSPMRPIVADLVGRGHDVTVLTGSKFADFFTSTGAAFAALQGQADYDYARFAEVFPDIATAPPGLWSAWA
jgi:UDP:flavonoid glycosyltransferase YjiC (YdhE family)